MFRDTSRKGLVGGVWSASDPFVIDTGSATSIAPCHRQENDTCLTGYFTAANGSLIPAYKKVDLIVTLELNKAFSWSFVKAGI